MSDSKSSTAGGVGCLGLLSVLLTVLFIGLKLTHHIAWAWVWVLAPLWIYVGLNIAVVLIVLVIALVVAIIAAVFD